MAQHPFRTLVGTLGITLSAVKAPLPAHLADNFGSKGGSSWKVTLRRTCRGKTCSLTTPWWQGSAYKGKPELADVLHALISDASYGRESFKDYCDNFGCSTDSIRAKKTHEQMKAMAPKVKALLGSEYRAVTQAAQDF